MIINDGYGHNYSAWDAFVEKNFGEQIRKLGPIQQYAKIEVFKSPKGRWMAFHHTDYTDIRIVDLETGDTVLKNFYSYFNGKKEDRIYIHHVNFTTFVPTYSKSSYEHKGKKETIFVDPTDYNSLKEMEDDAWNDLDSIMSLPLAFNSWTIWAADHEFYVDILDLREIDDGKLKIFDGGGFTLTRSAGHIRNYIKGEPSFWIKLVTPEERVAGKENALLSDKREFVVQFSYLEEVNKTHLNFSIDGTKFYLYDPYKKENREYKTKEKLPYQE